MRQRRQPEDDGTGADREVLGAIRFVQLPFLGWGLHLVLLPLEVLVFWGTWNPVGNVVFSLTVIGYSIVVGIRGWTPWRMPMYRVFGDGDSGRWNHNTTALGVAKFLQQPRIRLTAALITGSAALTPWAISGLSSLVGGVAFGGHPDAAHRFHPVAMMVVGYADGCRAGVLAMLWMSRELRDHWGDLHERTAVSTELPANADP